MKKLIIRIFCIVLVSLITAQSSRADHGMGGELTWHCLPNGAFIFTMKFYRDCNGIPAPASLNLTTNVPGVPTIPMTRTQFNDISPAGFMSDGTTDCPNCLNTGANPGVIQENVYVSQHVFLNGVPPAGGWDFYWGECCRSNALSNIANPGSVGFRLKATMFPYNGQNMNPCFDSSPYFIEKPNTKVCVGMPTIYHHIAGDTEYDSLVYEFTNPLSEAGTLVNFAIGYSFNDPFPGNNFLDPSTGELHSENPNGGYFASAIKVNSFKCGIKVAEITREHHIIVISNCPPVFNNSQNLPPQMAAPFQDSITGLYTLYSDTVMAGDTVNFMLNITDLQMFNDSSAQIVTFNSYGLQYGHGYTDPTAGCLIPPCATLTPPPPVTNPFAAVTTFDWQTDPAHLNFSFSCVQFSNTYYFMNKSADNYCPANGEEARVFSVTVMPTIPQPPVINNLGVLECPWGAGYVYQWFYERWAIPGATASSHTPLVSGTYHVLAVAPDGNGNYSEPYLYNPVGIYENNVLANITVVPNPSADGIFNLELPGTETLSLTAIVTDLSGRVVLNDELFTSSETSSHQLNLSTFTKGVYILRMESAGGFRKMMKLVVQ